MFLVISFAIKQSMQKNYKVTDQIYMDIEIDGKYSGRVTFGLFGETVPKTVKNFKQIALQGIEGNGYTGTRFLLAIKKVMILGGDIVYNNGSGAASIYGERFEDENFEIEPDSTGLLAMANLGVPDSNGCMFLITTMPTPWLSGKNIVFGKVIKGHDVVHRIEYLKTDYMDKLLPLVEVVKCGEIRSKPFYENHKNYELTLWAWIQAGWFPLSFSFAILGFFHYFIKQLDALI
ncbi:hypothetical protein HUJ05_004174 [Dendroctonus ponderosae]|nr:hypothetical protein HUJ05_004174 [Dendroctonus ponderosae]